MHEFAYFSIGGLPTKSGSTASAASQYSLRDLHVNIMLNPHAATQVRMSSYERQAGSNPKVRVADQPGTGRTACDYSAGDRSQKIVPAKTCRYAGR
jgi:hypothetical protein